MSVLIKGVKMPRNCHECDSLGVSDLVGLVCPANSFGRYDYEKRPDRCPLVEVPPHGDLIDKEALYNIAAELEASALAMIQEINRTPLDEMDAMAKWRKWAAILGERTAFKHDVFDAPVVIEAEGEEDD